MIHLQKKRLYLEKEEEDVFKMKLNLDQKDSKNGEIILLLNQLAGVTNGVKRLKEKRKKENKDGLDDDDSDEDFIDDMESIDGLNDEVIYTEDETRYIKSLDDTKRKQFIEMENKIIDLSKEEIPIVLKFLIQIWICGINHQLSVKLTTSINLTHQTMSIKNFIHG